MLLSHLFGQVLPTLILLRLQHHCGHDVSVPDKKKYLEKKPLHISFYLAYTHDIRRQSAKIYAFS